MPAAIPLVAMAVSAGAKAYSAHKANKAEKSQRGLDNAAMDKQDAAKQALIDRLTAAGYDPYGPQRSSSSSNSTSNTRSRGGYDRISKKETLAGYGGMEARIKALVEGRLGQNQAVGPAEQAAALRRINQTFAGTQARINSLAGAGASRGQLGSAAAPLEIARAGSINDYFATLPGEERRRRNEDLGLASGVMGQFGQQQHDTGTDFNNSTTNSSGSSSSLGGPDVSTLMALTSPSGARQTMQTGFSPLASGIGDLAGAAAQYYAGRTGGGSRKPIPGPAYNPYSGAAS